MTRGPPYSVHDISEMAIFFFFSEKYHATLAGYINNVEFLRFYLYFVFLDARRWNENVKTMLENYIMSKDKFVFN